MHEPQAQIATLEAEIESLSDRAERCRKIIMLTKVGALAGGLVLIALMIGLVRFSPVLLVAAIAALIGGIALAGSSQGTLEALRRSINERERLRTEIIDRLLLRTVEMD